MKAGLDPDNLFNQKIWRVSRILNDSPFSEKVQELTLPQMDFILEMYAKDNPEEWSFHKGKAPTQFPELMKAWEDVLTQDAFKQKKLWPNGKPIIPK